VLLPVPYATFGFMADMRRAVKKTNRATIQVLVYL